ncbi:MAG: hypothetical protein LBO66_03980 [Deltaproteobacteria bacterium]|jgi:lipopolysaccharide biosynthesis regulator YciM|nr:hypothetical protein [Deltaproteobacteria bacterium]
MSDPSAALANLEESLHRVFDFLLQRVWPGAGADGVVPVPAPVADALQRGVELFQELISKPSGLSLGDKARLGLRFFYASLYLANWPQALFVGNAMERLDFSEGDLTPMSFAAFYLHYYCLSIDNNETALRAYAKLLELAQAPPDSLAFPKTRESAPLVFGKKEVPLRGIARERRILPSLAFFRQSFFHEGVQAARFFPLEILQGQESFHELLAKASLNMILGFARTGEIARATEIFDSLPSNPVFAQTPQYLAKARVALLSAYGEAGALAEAESLYQAIQNAPPRPDLVLALELAKAFRVRAHLNSPELDSITELKKAQRLLEAWKVDKIPSRWLYPYAAATGSVVKASIKLGDLATGLELLAAMESLPRNDRVSVERLKAALHALDALLERKNFIQAERLSGKIQEASLIAVPQKWSPLYREFTVVKGRAALLPLLKYVSDGLYDRAEPFFRKERLRSLSEAESLAAARFLGGRAAELLREGERPRAISILQNLGFLARTLDIQTLRGDLADQAINSFLREGDRDNAAAVYRLTATFGPPKWESQIRLKPAMSLMRAYLYSLEPLRAKEVFMGLSRQAARSEDAAEMGRIVISVINALLHRQDWDEAEELWRELPKLGASREVGRAKAQAGLCLVLALDQNLLTDRGASVYRSIERQPGFAYAETRRGWALRTLISSFARRGLKESAVALSQNLASFDDSRESHLLRVRVILELMSVSQLQKRDDSPYPSHGKGGAPADARSDAVKILTSIKNEDIGEAETLYSVSNLNDIMPQESPKWAEALENLAAHYIQSGESDKARNIFWDMGDAFTVSLRPLSEARARVGEKLIAYYANKGAINKAQNVFANLRQIGFTTEIIHCVGRATVNLISFLASKGRFDVARPLLFSLKELRQTEEIQNLTAKGAAIILSFEENSLRDSIKVYKVFFALPLTPSILSKFGKATASLIRVHANLGELAKADLLYQDLVTHFSLAQFPPETRLAIAYALAILAERFLAKGLADNAHRVLGYLEDPAYPEEAQEIQAMLSVNVIAVYATLGEATAAEKVFLRALSFTRTPLVRRQVARAGVNLMAAFMGIKAFARAESLYRDIEALGDFSDVKEELAKANANAVVSFTEASILPKAERSLARLGNLSDQAAVPILLAKSRARLVLAYLKARKPEKALAHYRSLEETTDPEESVLARLAAAFALVELLLKKKDFKTVESVVAGLSQFRVSRSQAIATELSALSAMVETAYDMEND